VPVGLLDTSVVIDWDDADVVAALPDEAAVSAITFAELAAGPHLASSRVEGARRQARLQQLEATFDPIPFDAAAARCFGEVVAAISDRGRSHRGRSHRGRVADLLIAATALANDVALYTRNPHDFVGLDALIRVVGV
jgi:predicted nucleic acid-binding protein